MRPTEEATEIPKWQLVEKVAAVLEKSLAPTAKVEHDKRLPVVGRPEREPRQCDVVITYGEAPRQTLAIVEVQDRSSKPDITTFHGWIEKMREVGAQRLICVSALGYPQSIIDDVATRHGPTVILMTLEELQETKIPGLVFLQPSVIHQAPHFSFESVGPLRLQNPQLQNPPPHSEELQLSPNDKVFAFEDTPERLSLNELTARVLGTRVSPMFLRQGIMEPKSYSLELVVGSTEKELWLYVGEQRFKVLSLPMKLRIETHISEIPLTIFAYRQEFIDGILAWVASARGVIEDREIMFQLVFKPDNDGFLQLASIQQQGLERIALIVSPDESVLRTVIAGIYS